MKAMVLAAGVGSRLRPLTDELPKALVEVGGVPMLEIVLRRLMAAGVREAIVNVFHRADKIESFLKAKHGFGIRVELSRETELLDTGGGLKKAGWFFDDGRPFFLHNADVFTELDLGRMYRHHNEESGAIATLAVSSRRSDRRLLFDESGALRGRESAADGGTKWAGAPVENAERLAFNGIHVVSPEIFPKLTEAGVFSIHQAYLRLAGQGERVQAYRADGRYWRDIGGLDALEEARRHADKAGLGL